MGLGLIAAWIAVWGTIGFAEPVERISLEEDEVELELQMTERGASFIAKRELIQRRLLPKRPVRERTRGAATTN